jgi:hypothetical protein
LRHLTRIEDLLKIWSWLGDLRNDVAHCGMRAQPRPTKAILSDAAQLVERLRFIAGEGMNA